MPAKSSPTPTRERILDVSAELFRRQGYTGTGMKQIVTAAGAPFGSMYHHFPGGKEQLGEAVIRTSGAMYFRIVMEVMDAARDPVTGVRDCFAGAAAVLVETDYADACPIAAIALDVASTNEPLRMATADVFESWIEGGTAWFARAGIATAESRKLAITLINSIEGAFVLSRAMRTTEPLLVAGEHVAAAVEQALALKR